MNLDQSIPKQDCDSQSSADTDLPGDEICQMNSQENIVDMISENTKTEEFTTDQEENSEESFNLNIFEQNSVILLNLREMLIDPEHSTESVTDNELILEYCRSRSDISGDSIWKSESVHFMYQSSVVSGKLNHLFKQTDENPIVSQQVNTEEKLSEQKQ